MDEHRFDDLTRTLATAQSRRRVVGLIMGTAAGALQSQVSLAKNRKKKHKDKKDKKDKKDREKACTQDEEKCDGKCHPLCDATHQRDPRTCTCECRRQSCQGGKEFNVDTCRCECPRELEECDDGTCIGTDKCCDGFKKCGGGCIGKDLCCPHTHTECPDGECIAKDLGLCCGDERQCPTDPAGCCGVLTGEECSDDGCCNILHGFLICNGRCVDGETDSNNCGACGNACGDGAQCIDGTCEKICPPETTKCKGFNNGTLKDCCPKDRECCGTEDQEVRGCCGGNVPVCCVGKKTSTRSGNVCCEAHQSCGIFEDGTPFCVDPQPGMTVADAEPEKRRTRKSRRRDG